MLTCGEAEDAKENKEKEKQPGVHVVDDKRMVEHWGDARSLASQFWRLQPLLLIKI